MGAGLQQRIFAYAYSLYDEPQCQTRISHAIQQKNHFSPELAPLAYDARVLELVVAAATTRNYYFEAHKQKLKSDITGHK